MYDLDHMQHIVRLEHSSGPSIANTFFVDKMLESDTGGWFSEFVSALKSAGKRIACFFHTHAHAELQQLISRTIIWAYSFGYD